MHTWECLCVHTWECLCLHNGGVGWGGGAPALMSEWSACVRVRDSGSSITQAVALAPPESPTSCCSSWLLWASSSKPSRSALRASRAAWQARGGGASCVMVWGE